MPNRNRPSIRRREPSARLHLESLETRDTPAVVGTLDPSFDTDGKVTTTFGGTDVGRAVAVQPDGKIVVVGSTTSNNDFAVARYNPNGSPDTTFGGGDGQFPVTFGGVDVATDVAIQADGKIVIVGFTDQGGGTADNFAIARVLADGSGLDNAFGGGGNGKLIVDFGGDDEASGVALQPDGRIVVVGSTTNNNDFAILRLTTAGVLDTATFGTGTGKITRTFGGIDVATDVALQADGKIVVVGFTDQGGGIANNFAVLRLLADGSGLDNTFGPALDGRFTTNFGNDDRAQGVALRPDGRIVVAGAWDGGSADFAIMQLTTDGKLDTTFGGGFFGANSGKFNVFFGATIGSTQDFGTDVALQPDGKLVVSGFTNAGGTNDFAVVRVLADGSGLDASFDGDGKEEVDFGGDDRANAVAIDANGRVILAGSTTVGNDFAVARLIGTVEEGLRLAVGGNTNGTALVFTPNAATAKYTTPAGATVSAFPGVATNVRTAVGDINGDKVPDTVLVTGPGTPMSVTVISGVDNTTVLVTPFHPFGAGFVDGGFVTTADFDLDGRSEFVVTPDRGGGPRISIFSMGTGGAASLRANFLTIEENFRGGVRPGAGDINGDGVPDLAISAGFLGGPRIALIDGKKLFQIVGPLAATTDKLIPVDFFAFSPDLRDGAFVAVGDVNGDGFGDLVFGAGDGGGPNVRVVSGQAVMTVGGDAAALAPLASFFSAGTVDSRGGVRVAVVDVDGDNKADVVTGSGKGQPAKARMYLGKDIGGNTEPATFQDLDPFGGAVLADGVYVG